MNTGKGNNKLATDAPPAVGEADAVLARFQAFASALQETGRSIPTALLQERQLRAQLGAAEISGEGADELRRRLAAVVAGREAAARRRAAASEAVLSMSAELREARAVVSQHLAEIAQAVSNDFAVRWSRACSELERLHAEAGLLSAVLHVTIPTPPPYTSALNVHDGRPQVVFSGHADADAVTMPPEMATSSTTLNALDDAMALAAAVAQGKELNERHQSLARVRPGMPVTMAGLYRVEREFTHMNVTYEVGALVNADVMEAGLLYRRWQAREVSPLEGAPSRAA